MGVPLRPAPPERRDNTLAPGRPSVTCSVWLCVGQALSCSRMAGCPTWPHHTLHPSGGRSRHCRWEIPKSRQSKDLHRTTAGRFLGARSCIVPVNAVFPSPATGRGLVVGIRPAVAAGRTHIRPSATLPRGAYAESEFVPECRAGRAGFTPPCCRVGCRKTGRQDESCSTCCERNGPVHSHPACGRFLPVRRGRRTGSPNPCRGSAATPARCSARSAPGRRRGRRTCSWSARAGRTGHGRAACRC